MILLQLVHFSVPLLRYCFKLFLYQNFCLEFWWWGSEVVVVFMLDHCGSCLAKIKLMPSYKALDLFKLIPRQDHEPIFALMLETIILLEYFCRIMTQICSIFYVFCHNLVDCCSLLYHVQFSLLLYCLKLISKISDPCLFPELNPSIC